MDEAQVQRILNNPEFQTMAKKKTSLGIMFSLITLIVWFGFWLLVGFDPAMFAAPISAGASAPVGFYIATAIMIFVPVITAIYISKANGEFDSLTRKVIDDISSGKV